MRLPDWKNAGGETGGEVFLNVRFRAARATAWCDAGHEVGRGQIALGKAKPIGAQTLEKARSRRNRLRSKL